MKFQVGERVKVIAVPELGSYVVVARRKIGPWTEYDLEGDADQSLRERVAENQLVRSGLLRPSKGERR